MQAFFVPDGDRFVATELTRGPWDPGAQHAGPPSALLGRALERSADRADARLARVTMEILRPVPIGTLEVTAERLRPGRSVELLAATLRCEGTEVMRATAWSVRTDDIGTDFPPTGPPPGGPETGRVEPFFLPGDHVGWGTAMEIRFVGGSFVEPGPATVWFRMRHPLVAGEDPSPLQRVLVAADGGNGVSASVDFSRYVFVNTDLTVHLHRQPVGEWVCLDAATVVEPDGIGLASTRIADEQGWIGRGAQTLFVARR